jgi:uncharacterized protein YceK
MNLSRVVLVAALAGLLSGCGTINNQVMLFYGGPDSRSNYDPQRDYVYGGVKFDATAAGYAFSNEPGLSPGSRLLCALFILDLPISAVFDTLYLPVNIPADQKNRAAREALADRPLKPVEPSAGDFSPKPDPPPKEID